MGTRLTKFEERLFEGKFVDDGAKNQASDNLRRVSTQPSFVAGVSRTHRPEIVCKPSETGNEKEPPL